MPLPRKPVEDAVQNPITHKQMNMLLEPLRGHLQRLESSLADLSGALSMSREVGTTKLDPSFVSKAQKVACDTWPAQMLDVHQSNASLTHGGCVKETARKSSNGTHAAQQPGSPLPPSMDMVQQPSGDPVAMVDSIRLSELKEKKDTRTVQLRMVSGAGSGLLDSLRMNKQLCLMQIGGSVSSVEVRIIEWAESFLNTLTSFKEPQRHGWMFQISSSAGFQALCMLVIMFNSGMVAYSADWQIRHIGEKEPELLRVLELFCVVFFALELLLRLGVHGCYFFINEDHRWNIFDFILVSISVVDLIVESAIGDHSNSNVVFMRLLRILKLARILRAMRSFKFCAALAKLLDGLMKSLASLFWGVIMLVFILYLFALVFMQSFVDALNENDIVDPEMRHTIVSKFGSFSLSLLSLYKAITGGDDWSIYYDAVYSAGPLYGLVFLFYTFIISFALFNILTGDLVEKAMSANKPDRAEQIMSQRRTFIEEKTQFLSICRAIDGNSDEKISYTEFEKYMENPAVLDYLAFLGIEIKDIEIFFLMIALMDSSARGASDTREISIEHFVEQCLHMKGTATAMDMQRSLLETHLVHKELRSMYAAVFSKFDHLEHELADTRSSLSESLLCEA